MYPVNPRVVPMPGGGFYVEVIWYDEDPTATDQVLEPRLYDQVPLPGVWAVEEVSDGAIVAALYTRQQTLEAEAQARAALESQLAPAVQAMAEQTFEFRGEAMVPVQAAQVAEPARPAHAQPAKRSAADRASDA